MFSFRILCSIKAHTLSASELHEPMFDAKTHRSRLRGKYFKVISTCNTFKVILPIL